jgi:hypothetical protein
VPDQGELLIRRDLFRLQRRVVRAVGGSDLFWDLLEYGSDGWRARGVEVICSHMGYGRRAVHTRMARTGFPSPAKIVGAGAAMVALHEYITKKIKGEKATLARAAKRGGWSSEFALSIWCSSNLGAGPRALLEECREEGSMKPLERRFVHYIETRKR